MAITPNNPNKGFWNWNNVEGGILTGIGGFVLGSNKVGQGVRSKSDARLVRLRQNQIALTKGDLNPRQFVSQQARDGYPATEIKYQLQAWGEKWEGCDFTDPSNFSVTIEYGWRGNLGLPKASTLNVEADIRPDTEETLGRRGGATIEDLLPEEPLEASEIEAVEAIRAIKEPIMNYGNHQWSPPNPVLELGEAVNGKRWESFTYVFPDTPLHETFVGTTLISFGTFALSVYLWSWVAKRFSGGKNFLRWLGNVDDPLDTTKQLHLTVEIKDDVTQLCGVADSILRILTAFHNKAITRDAAISLLTQYHFKTQEEAATLLETREGAVHLFEKEEP